MLGWTISSVRVYTSVYETPDHVSAELFRAFTKFEMSHCCQSAALHEPSPHDAEACVVPWFDGANPIMSSTMARVSGQNRIDHRLIISPWLWPMIAIRRPARAYIVRMAYTTYSPLIWTSPVAWSG